MIQIGVGVFNFALLLLDRQRPIATFTEQFMTLGRGREARRLERVDLVGFHEHRNGADLIMASGERVRLSYFGLRRSSIELLRQVMPSYILPPGSPG